MNVLYWVKFITYNLEKMNFNAVDLLMILNVMFFSSTCMKFFLLFFFKIGWHYVSFIICISPNNWRQFSLWIPSKWFEFLQSDNEETLYIISPMEIYQYKYMRVLAACIYPYFTVFSLWCGQKVHYMTWDT